MIHTAEIKVYGKNIGCIEGIIQGESEYDTNKCVELILDAIRMEKVTNKKTGKVDIFVPDTPFLVWGKDGVEWLKLYERRNCSSNTNAYSNSNFRLIPISEILSLSVTFRTKDTSFQTIQREAEWDKKLVETTKRCVDLIHGKNLTLVEKSEGIYRVLKEELGGDSFGK